MPDDNSPTWTGDEAQDAVTLMPDEASATRLPADEDATESEGAGAVWTPPGAPVDPWQELVGHEGERHEDQRLIGEGGMGQVRLVWDPRARRWVALKRVTRTESAGARQRFLREARVTAQLEHPGVIPVYEVGVLGDGTPYYTMKHIKGVTLRQALDAAPDSAARLDLFDALVDVCQTVAFAHSNGVCHRDLKPDNVMIGSFGETVVMDWGLVRLQGAPGDEPEPTTEERDSIDTGDRFTTRQGVVMGTPNYMSPEQARGEAADTQGDVWALGVILHELVYGRLPFDAPRVEDIFARVRAGWQVPPDPVPEELKAILARAFALKPADRYPSAEALVQDLDAWRKGHRVGAYRYSAVDVLRRFVRRHRVAVGTGLLAAVAIAVVVAVSFQRVRQERDLAHQALNQARSEALLARARESLLGRAPDRAVAYLLGGLTVGVPERRVEFLSELARAEASLPPSRVLEPAGHEIVGLWASPGGAALLALKSDGEVLRWRGEERSVVATLPGEVLQVVTQPQGEVAVAIAIQPDSGDLTATRLSGEPTVVGPTWTLGSDAVDTAELSSSGRYLVVQAKDTLLEVWEVQTGRLVSSASMGVYVLTSFAGPQTLAVCSGFWGDGSGIELRDLEGGQVQGRLALPGPCRRLYSDGATLVAESSIGLRYTWNEGVLPGAPPTWTRSGIVKSEDGWVSTAAGLLVTDGRDGRLVAQRLADGEEAWVVERDYRTAGFVPAAGGARLATFDSGVVTIRDPATGAGLGAIPIQTSSATEVAFLADGQVATLAASGEVKRWSGAGEGLVPVRFTPKRLGWKPSLLALARGDALVANTAGLYRLGAVGASLVLEAPEEGTVACALRPAPAGGLDVLWAARHRTGGWGEYSTTSHGLHLLRYAADGSVVAQVSTEGELGFARLSSLGDGRAAVTAEDGCVRVLDVDSGSSLLCREGTSFTDAVVSPDGASLAARHSGGLQWWGPGGDGALALRAGVDDLLWSPDSRRLAAVTSDGQLWLSSPGAAEARVPLDAFAQSPLAWSPDVERVAVATRTGAVFVAGPQPLLIEHGAPAAPFVLAFSPDSTRLAIGREGGSVQVVELATGGLLADQPLDSGGILALAWSEHGDGLLVGAQEGRVFDLPVRDAVTLEQRGLEVTNWRLCPESFELLVTAGEGSVAGPGCD